MKTKNKMIAMMEIAVVLCSLFLVAMLPAIAAELTAQEVSTTASDDNYVLGIYGNANEDNNIDMRDLTYVKLIFFGKKPETELADAKYDGKINPLDFIQIKLIIVGKEKELTLVDSMDRIVTVKKPIERIAVFNLDTYTTMRSLNAIDKVVGVGKFSPRIAILFPEFSDYPTFGSTWKPDYEALLALNPDVVFIYGRSVSIADKVVEKLMELDPRLTVIRFDCLYPITYADEVTKLGYIFEKKEEAKELIKFYEEHLSIIREKVEGLSEDEKTKAYFEKWGPYYTVGTGSAQHELIIAAGAKNIFDDISGNKIEIDKEAVIRRNPEIIVRSERARRDYYVTDDITVLSDIRDEIMSRTELAKVNAVENGKVYIITVDVISGPLYFVSRAYMAKWFHPDMFDDLDPKAIHQEYLTRFQGLDYDLDKHGVFVYPEPR